MGESDFELNLEKNPVKTPKNFRSELSMGNLIC